MLDDVRLQFSEGLGAVRSCHEKRGALSGEPRTMSSACHAIRSGWLATWDSTDARVPPTCLVFKVDVLPTGHTVTEMGCGHLFAAIEQRCFVHTSHTELHAHHTHDDERRNVDEIDFGKTRLRASSI